MLLMAVIGAAGGVAAAVLIAARRESQALPGSALPPALDPATLPGMPGAEVSVHTATVVTTVVEESGGPEDVTRE